jgi:putative Holliday junction resolvase
MRFLGIDYGKKRVGIALSSEDNRFAFPKKVLVNERNLVVTISKFCKENNVGGVVIGESKDFKGKANLIMKDILTFKKKLESKTALPIYLEPEFMTSQEAARIAGENELLDASAAAIILQSYLNKQL